MQAVPDALPANVHVSGRLQLPLDGAGRGSFSLSSLSLHEAVFTVCCLLGVSRPAFLLPPCDKEAYSVPM